MLGNEAQTASCGRLARSREDKIQGQILGAAKQILEHYRVEEFVDLRLQWHRQMTRKRPRGRPPGGKIVYIYQQHNTYSLHWSRNTAALAAEGRTDGVVPLLCTDQAVLPKAVLQAYKFQARLEKRFAQFKDVHRAAPLWRSSGATTRL